MAHAFRREHRPQGKQFVFIEKACVKAQALFFCKGAAHALAPDHATVITGAIHIHIQLFAVPSPCIGARAPQYVRRDFPYLRRAEYFTLEQNHIRAFLKDTSAHHLKRIAHEQIVAVQKA